ncbi:MAG: DNA polymerase I [Blautia sp.]|jgi:DNA polymerase-1
MSEKILLIDGHSILNRAFYGLPDLTNSEGHHTGAVYGFLNIMFKILEEEKADYLTVAFDVHAPTFRHEMFQEYKGTRKPMPQELREQVPLIQEVLGAMGVCIASQAGYEADDLLGTMAKKSEAKGMDVTILSGDRDLLQLATDRIQIRIPKTSRGGTVVEDYHTAEVLEKYQVTPPQIVELKALMGDTADNIPGIPGVGEKTATKLIVEFGSIENAYAHLEEVKPNKARESLREHYDMAVLSKKLAQICTDCPVEVDYACAKLGNLYTPEAYEYFRRLEFKNLLGRFADTPQQEKEIEKTFSSCTDLSQGEEIFNGAAALSRVGVQVLEQAHRMLGVSLSLGTETWFFPVQGFFTEEYLGDKLKKLAMETQICAMDVKSLLAVVEIADGKETFDAGIAAYLLNPLKSAYTYDDIAGEYLQKMLPSQAELLGKGALSKTWEERPGDVELAACYMAYVALEAAPVLMKVLRETGMESVFREIEMPLVVTLHSMEQEGILVRQDELRVYGEQLQVRITELEKIIYEQAGETFNINSPKQLGVILFEKMKLPGGKKTKTGYSTAADVLERLAPEAPVIQNILEYRQLTKLKSTYADGLANYIGTDGRIHSTFNQTITATGRISSTEPNLQNIPVRMELGRLIRKVFVPKEGCVFLDADYSQIELRVLAHMSGDEKLIQAYKEAQDIHRITASQVFHIPFDEVTSLQRRNAKAVNFGIVYGISSFGLSQDLSITRKEAAEYIQRYFETYPKIKGFLDGLVEKGKTDGYVTTMFGRRRPIPELKSSNFMQRSFGERIAMNSPIQGTAADIIKIAMNRVFTRLREENLRSKLILQVHDELLIETYEEELAQVSKILEEEMKHAAHLAVALEVDMHTGNNWYEAK